MHPARSRTLLFAFLVGLSCLSTGVLAQPSGGLSDQTELARVVTLYDAGKYAECVKEFATLIGGQPRKIDDPEVLERARIYYAACLIGNGQVADSEEQMRKAIRQNPLMRPPDSLVFPGTVIDRFFRVRDSLVDEIKRAEAKELQKQRAAAAAASRRAAAEKRRVERLEALASREVVVNKNERWVAAIPFGVGQFQNRDPWLGYLFLGSEVILAGTALGATVIQLDLNARADDDPPPDPDDLNPKSQAAYQTMLITSWGFLGVATIGVLQAQLAYVPEFRDTVKKPLSPDLRRPPEKPAISFVPVAAPTPGGGTLGVVGRF